MESFFGLVDFIEFDFLRNALIATILLSLTCGLISPFVVAKKYAFIGSAVSHSSILSLALTFGLFNLTSAPAVYTSLLLITLVLNGFLARSTYKEDVPADSLIGIYFTATMGLGIILHGILNKNSGDLLSYLFGNILLIENSDLRVSFFLMVLVFAFILIPFKSWLYTTFDPDGATVSGLSTKKYHYLFFFIITLVIISAIKLAGTVLINTLLIIPGVFALGLGKSIRQVFIYSVVFCFISSVLGLIAANALDQPAGATMAVTQFSLLLIFKLPGLKRK